MRESRVRLMSAVANGGLALSLGWLAFAGRADLRWPLLVAAVVAAVLCVSAVVGLIETKNRKIDDGDHR